MHYIAKKIKRLSVDARSPTTRNLKREKGNKFETMLKKEEKVFCKIG